MKCHHQRQRLGEIDTGRYVDAERNALAIDRRGVCEAQVTVEPGQRISGAFSEPFRQRLRQRELAFNAMRSCEKPVVVSSATMNSG